MQGKDCGYEGPRITGGKNRVDAPEEEFFLGYTAQDLGRPRFFSYPCTIFFLLFDRFVPLRGKDPGKDKI